MKVNKVLVVFVIIFFLTTVASVSWIVYEEFLDNGLSSNDVVEDELSNVDEEELDVNSRLVQSLYNKVVLNEDNYYKYFMYDDNDNYVVSEASEESKLTLAYYNLKNCDFKTFSSDSTDLSSLMESVTIPGLSYQYTLDKNEFNSSLYSYYTISFIPYDDMLNAYKDIFGNNATIDKTVPIKTDFYNVKYYIYNERLDGYIPYVTEGGGTSGSYFTGEITKALRDNNQIIIYENIKEVPLGYGIQVSDPMTYVYTFNIDDDGMFSFVSRIKE